jgi:hypothetical protein
MEKSPANLGEGNPEAAAEFNEAEQKFVKSARGNRRSGGARKCARARKARSSRRRKPPKAAARMTIRRRRE